MKSENKTIVRIRSTVFQSSSGEIVAQKRMYYLKRKSSGHSPFFQEVIDVGVEDAFNSIENFHAVEDGIYELVLYTYADWETGIVDDWDYSLVPYKNTP